MIERIRKYLVDSYNGLYKIVLEPYMPRRNTVFALLAGFLIGLIFAYALSPTVFYDAAPSMLHQSWQDEWVKLLADRYAAANSDVTANIRDLLTYVDDPVGIIDRLIQENPGDAAKLQAIRPFAEAVQTAGQTAPAPDTGGIFGNFIWPWILVPILIVVLFVIFTLVYNILIYPNLVGPAIDFVKRGGKPNTGKEEIDRIKADRKATELAKVASAQRLATSGRGAPVFQRISRYTPGRDYDDSFAIETADDVFLGECGASISDTVMVGDQKKVSAIEVWIFDKDDFTQTQTRVFVAPAGMLDPATRAKLETKGDLIEAVEGASTTFETKSLEMEVRIANLAYVTGGGLPPNAAFDGVTYEFAVWQKSGTAVAKAAGAVMGQATFAAPPPPAPTPLTSSFAPPPAQSPLAPPPLTSTPPVMAPRPLTPPPLVNPSSPGVTPLMPPPLQQPIPREDDDPFGGTGDFTPVG